MAPNHIIRYIKRIIYKSQIIRPSYIFWISFIFLRGITFAQTCILLTGNYGNIYAGADSWVKGKNPVTGKAIFDSTCKIIKCGNFFFAATGVYQNEARNFYLYEIAKSSCQNEINMEVAINKIISASIKPLEAIAELASRFDKPAFSKYRSELGIVQFVVFNVIKNIPVVHLKCLRAKNNTNNTISVFVDAKESKFASQPFKYLILGSKFEMMKTFRKDDLFIMTDSANRIRSLIRQEIEADKTGILGGPINVLWIHGDGHHWIDPKPPCPN